MATSNGTSPEKTTSNVSVKTTVEYTLALTETGYTISNCQLQGKAKLNSGSSKNMIYQYWGVSAVNESGNTVWLIPKGETSITMGLIITGTWFASEPRSGTGVLSGTRGHTSKTVSLITNHVGFKDDGASNFYSGTPVSVTIPAKSSYNVAYNANGGSGAPGSQTKWYGETLTLHTNTPSRTGYSFSKWNTKSDGTGTNYNPGASYTANAALTLYAIWYPTVTYNANGGSGAPAQAVKTPGTPITISTTRPTRTGYTFSKWNTSADGSGTDYSSGASYSTDAPLVLYAQWTPNTYQVSFDANTGKHAPSAIDRTYGQPVTLPSTAPVKMAAEFVGWATNSSGTGTLYQPGGSYTSTVAATEVLYAVWRSTYTDPAFAIDVVRTDDQGIEEDDGDHALITVLWSINPLIEPDTGESTNTATLECYMSYVNSQGQTITTEVELEDVEDEVENELQGTKTSGTARALVSNIDTDTRYTIEVTVVDSRGTSVTKTEILSMAFFTMDFLAGGHGVGIGKAATREMFDVGMQAQFDKPIMIAETDVPPTFYYTTKPAVSNLPVKPCIVIQTSDWSIWYCDNSTSPSYHQLSTRIKGNAESSYRTGDVNLTPANVGAATSDHTHGLLHHDLVIAISSTTDSWSTIADPYYNGFILKSIRYQRTHPVWGYDWGSGIAFGGGDTKGLISINYKNPDIMFAGGAGSKPAWRMEVTGNSGGSYNLANMSVNGHEHNYLKTVGGYGGSTHAIALKSYFDANKSTTPRNKLINLYSSAYGNGSQAIGYFLQGYDSNPYGGFFVANYNTPYYVGISGGAYTQWELSKNGHTHSYLPLSGGTITGNLTVNGYLSARGGGDWAQSVVVLTPAGNSQVNRLTDAGSYMEATTSNHGAYGISWWSSDVRMKSNIGDSETAALQLVNAIRHRSFDMRGEHYSIGYVAQEIEELDPQLVIKVPQSREVNGVSYFTGDYRYQIDQTKVIPYLSKAIQELSAENDELKRKNAELESKLEAIERKLGL